MLLEEGVCYDQCVLLAKLYQPLPCFILYSKATGSHQLENLQARVTFMLPVLWGHDLGSRVLVFVTGSNVHGS